MRRVLDDCQAMPGSNLYNRWQSTGVTGVMHHDNGTRARRDLFFDFLWIDGKFVRPQNIGEAHLRPGIQYGIGCSHKRKRWHNHFIARANAQRQASQMQRLGSIRDRQGMFCPNLFGKLAFELLGDSAHCQPAAVQYIQHSLLFFRAII